MAGNHRLQDQPIEGLALPIVTPIAEYRAFWRATQNRTTNSYVLLKSRYNFERNSSRCRTRVLNFHFSGSEAALG
jgi:hypothetical protein